MKRFLLIFGAGFVSGLMFAPASGRQLRRNLLRRVRSFGSKCKPLHRRYLWGDSETRLARSEVEIREQTMDQTLADSFPASDPPSTIPNPSEESIVA